MKKFISIALAVLLVSTTIAMAGVAVAENDEITTRADDFFSSYAISLTPTGSGSFLITFKTSAIATASQLGVITYSVQRKDGSSWTTVASGLSGQLGSNTSSYTFGRTYSGSSGQTYRVYANHYCVKTNGLSKTVGSYSGTITP